MSTEQNKELATRMVEEIFNRGNRGAMRSDAGQGRLSPS